MQSAPVSLTFQDSRPAHAPRDLAPVFGLFCAIAMSAVLWALPIAAWMMLR